MRGTYTNGLVLLVVVFWSTAGDAAPTLNACDSVAEMCDSRLLSSANPVCAATVGEITGLTESYLAAIGQEFHKPTVRYSGGASQTRSIKPLPPVPSTFVLALLGFLFVTAVKDQKLWLAVAASIWWAGQSGFALRPQLVSHLDPRGRCVSGSFHAPRLLGLRLFGFSGDAESSLLCDSLVGYRGSLHGVDARRSAGIGRGKSCGRGGGDNARAERKVLQAAISVGLCCLDCGFVSRVTRQFLFSSHNGVNSRLARGPPR